jgi:hypothetical protein
MKLISSQWQDDFSATAALRRQPSAIKSPSKSTEYLTEKTHTLFSLSFFLRYFSLSAVSFNPIASAHGVAVLIPFRLYDSLRDEITDH